MGMKYLFYTYLDHALQCVYDDVINDIQIVPVGISYQGTPLQMKWPQNLLQYIKGCSQHIRYQGY